jgi:hypothetical protein
MTRSSSSHPATDEPLDRPRDQVVGAPGTVRRQLRYMVLGGATGLLVGIPAGWLLAELVRDDGEPMSWIIAVGAALVCTAIGALVATYPSLRTEDPHAAGRP